MTQIKEIKKIVFLSNPRNYITIKLQIMHQRRLLRKLSKTLKEKFLTEYRDTIRTSTRDYIRGGESKFGERVYPLKCELLNLGVHIKILDKIRNDIMREEANIYVLEK